MGWFMALGLGYGLSLLGGSLPRARGCGLVHPSDLHGIFGAG